MKYLSLSIQKLYLLLSVIDFVATRWNPGNLFVHAYSWNSPLLLPTRQQQQLQQKPPPRIHPNRFITRQYYNHRQGIHSTSSSLRVQRDPLIMMPSQTPMVPYKVCFS